MKRVMSLPAEAFAITTRRRADACRAVAAWDLVWAFEAARRLDVRGGRCRLTEPHATTPLSCSKCGSTDVSTLSVKPEVVFWWCARCGSIWGAPTQPVPDTFDADVQRLRTRLQGTAARLDRVASHLERVPASVLVADHKGRYVAVNDQACALTGYSRAELLGKAIIDLTPSNAVEVYERLWDVRSTKQHGLYQIRRKDGSVVTVRYCSYVDVALGIRVSFITK